MTHAVAADRHLSVREFLLALAAASAVTAGAILSGAPVQLWSDASRLADRFFTSSAPSAPKREGTAAIANPDRNPFVAFVGSPGIRFHPLIGYVGATWPTDQPYFAVHDYFGFRNSFSAYFDVPGAYRYVVITGNSEALGATHSETIAERLERALRERTKQNFRVINLAMNSATTAHEINYFVNLVFNLRPEFVISHSLATDIAYGSDAPDEFQYLGMFPLTTFEPGWARTIHLASIDQRVFDRAFAPLKSRFLAGGVVKNVKRYRALAESGGGHFIWGVQKIDARNAIGSPSEAQFKLVDQIYRSFATTNFSEFGDVDMIDFNQIVGLSMNSRDDPIHTDDPSARRIAEAYADRIIGRLSVAPKSSDPSIVMPRRADEREGRSNNRDEVFARAAILSRIMQIAKLSGDDDRKLDDAASSVGFRRSTALLGNVDMFAQVGDGQYHVRGWGLDSAHVEVDDPLMVVAISDGAVVMARETAGKHPPLARDYKIPESAGNNLQFEARLFCEPGKPVLFFVLTATGTYARLTTHRCE
jgi:hypothetical protein